MLLSQQRSHPRAFKVGRIVGAALRAAACYSPHFVYRHLRLPSTSLRYPQAHRARSTDLIWDRAPVSPLAQTRSRVMKAISEGGSDEEQEAAAPSPISVLQRLQQRGFLVLPASSDDAAADPLLLTVLRTRRAREESPDELHLDSCSLEELPLIEVGCCAVTTARLRCAVVFCLDLCAHPPTPTDCLPPPHFINMTG